MGDTQNHLLPAPQGMRELKRLFGSDNVTEELIAPPHLSGGNQPEEWCYVITITPDHPVLPPAPEDNFEFTELVSDIESVLCKSLSLQQCMDNHIDPDTEQMCNTGQMGARRLIIPIDDVEAPNAIETLKRMNHDQLQLDPDDADIALYQRRLQRAAHGVKWHYVQDAEGCYFETSTRLTRNPRELELGICALLEVSDDLLMAPVEGKARIPLKIILEGNHEALGEWSLPKPGQAAMNR